MATRFQKNLAKEKFKPSLKNHVEPVPDIADFMMNDWFYGGHAVKTEPVSAVVGENKKNRKDEYKGNVTVGGKGNSTGKLTQEWLEEAKRMVADSPPRHASPAKFMGSPRFAAASNGRNLPPALERRDPLSRSARRHRSSLSISDEIINKTIARNSVPSAPAADVSQASAVHQWFSNILNPHSQPEPINPLSSANSQPEPDPSPQARSPPLPPKLSKTPRKSRFRDALPTRRQPPVLSPPRNLVESAHRRSASSSTCFLEGGAAAPRRLSVSLSPELEAADDVRQINSFLKRQRAAIGRISDGEISAKAKIVLSGSSAATSSTSSIVAAICYAWLLENGEKGKENAVVVPVVNMRRGKMWKNKQASWLFYHLGIDASALLFTDEVDLEGLIMARQLSILVIGQDVLKTNGKVGSPCTVLTDNYCEDAYNLLQAPNLKKLLLAGILLDTQDLNCGTKFLTNRDAEAVQLLLVGSSLNYRHELFEQLVRDHKSSSFFEAMKKNYGNPFTEDKEENGLSQEPRLSTRKSTSISQEPRLSTRKSASISPTEAKISSSMKQKPTAAPAPVPRAEPAPVPVKAPEPASSGKNKNFFAKLFRFGSK